MRRPLISALDLPWKPDDPCPCHSGLSYGTCCLAADGLPLIRLQKFTPPPPPTGISNPGCYMATTLNCSEDISREHYISENILEQLGSDQEVGGLPWIPTGETRQYGSNALAAKILCSRHNTAFSPLDTAAGHAFREITAAFVHAAKDSLSTRSEFFLISGDALEFWSVKTLVGMYKASIVAKDGAVLAKTHRFEDGPALASLQGVPLQFPLGLHLFPTTVVVDSKLKFQFAPLSSDEFGLYAGLRIATWGVHLDCLVEHRGLNPEFLSGPGNHRPWLIDLVGHKRTSRIVMSWAGNRTTATRIEVQVKKRSPS